MVDLNFPTASHSYFKIMNLEQQRDAFLSSERTQSPQFTYGASFSSGVIQRRAEEVKQHGVDIEGFKLIEVGRKLQDDVPKQQDLSDFRLLNVARYGGPSSEYVNAILQRVESRVDPTTQVLWDYITEACQYQSDSRRVSNIWPTHERFEQIRQYGRKYMGDLLQSDHSVGLIGICSQVLDATGLSASGWTLQTRDDASAAHVIHKNKRVTIGSNYLPRNRKATYRIIAHEVYGHALRGPHLGLWESEGFAILLEQLLDKNFKPRRMYRYLAGALGWGTQTEPKDFCQVFEVIWRCMVILSKYPEEDAMKYAFSECARVFRGGRPDIAGAVYLKDTIYFASNMMFWQSFEKKPIGYNDFIDIANGSKKVLSK